MSWVGEHRQRKCLSGILVVLLAVVVGAHFRFLRARWLSFSHAHTKIIVNN